jgi:dTDP-4-amino-4,6-dideoxygalactose transaminase
MPMWAQKRQANGRAIDQGASQFSDVRKVDVPSYIEHAEYKHYLFVRPERLCDGWSRDRIVNEIFSRGVPCLQGSCSEVYLEKAFDDTGWRPKKGLKNAVELGETSLMFLVHPTLTDTEIIKTCDVLKEALTLAQK